MLLCVLATVLLCGCSGYEGTVQTDSTDFAVQIDTSDFDLMTVKACGDMSADLNHVYLAEYAKREPYQAYLGIVKADPAVSFEYSVG